MRFQLTLFGAVPHWTAFYSIPYYILTYATFGIFQACGWPNEVAIMVGIPSLVRHGHAVQYRPIGFLKPTEASSWDYGQLVSHWESMFLQDIAINNEADISAIPRV